MDVPEAPNFGELVYAQRLDKLYQVVQFGCSQISGLAYCFYASPCDGMQELSYSKLWRATIKFEYKTRADEGGQFYLALHKQEFYAVPMKERLCLYVGAPKWWREQELCRTSEVQKSLLFAYLGRESVDGREPSSSTIRGHCFVWLAQTIVFLVLMPFFICAFLPDNLAVQELAGNNACMTAGVCGGIALTMPQHVHDFVCVI